MVVKQNSGTLYIGCKFESSVVSYGSQTNELQKEFWRLFESSVVSYGSQTEKRVDRQNL